MPTGYTCYIEDGSITDASQFLLLCARAFGACVEMRDEPLWKPIPEEFKVDKYFEESVIRAEQDLIKAKSLSLEEARIRCENYFKEELNRRKRYKETQQALLDRYKKVLEGVVTWNPPTKEHEKLKQFAFEQISMCLPDPGYYERLPEPKMEDPEEWLAGHIEDCEKRLQRRIEDENRHKNLVATRNKWLKDLRDSL